MPSAHAEAGSDQDIMDLNYVVYAMSLEPQKAINELGADYLLKADAKMKALVQNSKFLGIKCNYSATFMAATFMFGDGQNNTEVTAFMDGSNVLKKYVKKNGQEQQVELPETQMPVMNNLFKQVCENMSQTELDQLNSDINFYGSGHATFGSDVAQ